MKQFFYITLSFIISVNVLYCNAGNPGLAAYGPLKTTDIKMLSTFLTTVGGNMVDGNRIVFDAQYSNDVDGNDAFKLMNPGENFGLTRNGQVLAVEARQPMAAGDTMFYYMTNLLQQVYKLEIDPQFLATKGIKCELVDRYLNTKRNISLTDSNHFTLEVTSDPASKAANRLFVVFSSDVIVPPIQHFSFTGISAINNDNRSISINWQVNQELNVADYEVERSIDKINFKSLSGITPLHNDHDGSRYQYDDISALNNDNFYRIKAVNKNGPAVYSDIMKVSIPVEVSSMELYPNPVVNHVFQIKLNQLQPGRYLLKLINNSGQQVYHDVLSVNGNFLTQTIRLDGNVGKGNYNLSVWAEGKIIAVSKLIVQ
ncbi:MAG: T9SS type A sorting domain-containing protein [Ferruginibacter sp.]